MKIMRDYQVFLHFLSDYSFLYHILVQAAYNFASSMKTIKTNRSYVKTLVN